MGLVFSRWLYFFIIFFDGGREFIDYYVYIFDIGFFEFLYLFFYCGFKSEVRCEEVCFVFEEEGEEGVVGWVEGGSES